MLVSLAVQDILIEHKKEGPQLYGYQYANDGTDILEWKHMPSNISFKAKHVSMMRFCGFMLDCIEPIFAENFSGYDQEMLIAHLYGTKGIFGHKRANVSDKMKETLHKKMKNCFEFCRSYMKYWIELERSTKFGNEESNVTAFFNLKEMERILESSKADYNNVRASAELLNLTETGVYGNYVKSVKDSEIFDSLIQEKRLRRIAWPDKEEIGVAETLVKVIYQKCMVEN